MSSTSHPGSVADFQFRKTKFRKMARFWLDRGNFEDATYGIFNGLPLPDFQQYTKCGTIFRRILAN
jgi:hypothetical protein